MFKGTPEFFAPSDFWVPLLALFTGAREGELCQLLVSDVYEDRETGIWLLDINDREGKKLKSDETPRLMPVHRHVIELGFVDYWREAEKCEQSRLFPHERRNKREEFSAFSKRFNRYKRARHVAPKANQSLDFHSFRHNVTTNLVGQGVEEYLVNDITGHSNNQRSEAFRTYSGSVVLAKKRDVLDKLNYVVDFSKIKPNGFIWRSGDVIKAADDGRDP